MSIGVHLSSSFSVRRQSAGCLRRPAVIEGSATDDAIAEKWPLCGGQDLLTGETQT